jgi:thioredoxin-related protein
MNNIKKIFSLCLLFAFVTSYAQEQSAINWASGLTWQQVKEKAKKENKYIFIDAFATWCGPCKKMDKEIYPNDTIGSYFNEKFISIKVQMDQTEKDNAFVKSWYEDAEAINKQYRVQGYPTLIFLSPEGTLINQVLGYQSVNDLIAAAQTATRPGQVYINPFAEYDSLVTEYKKGNKNYNRMPYMIRTAYNVKEDDFGRQLLNEHNAYVATLSKEERYTKENIQFWSGFTLSTKKRIFKFFYSDRDFIDKVMNQKGYAVSMVDKTIQIEIVDSFFKTQPGGAIMSSDPVNSLFMTIDEKADKTEANWNTLYKMLRQKFRVEDSKRNLFTAKITWYQKHNNYVSFLKSYEAKLKEFPPDLSDPWARESINRCSFDIVFMKITDVRKLLQYSDLMKKCLEVEEKENNLNTNHLDTYANLLYKAGRWADAIRWEEKAVEYERSHNKINTDFLSGIIAQMRDKQPTNIDRATIWEGISWVNWKGASFPKVIYVQDQNKKPILHAAITLKRSSESKLTENQYKHYGYTVFENACVGDEISITKEGYSKGEATVGKNPSAIVVTLKKNNSN